MPPRSARRTLERNMVKRHRELGVEAVRQLSPTGLDGSPQIFKICDLTVAVRPEVKGQGLATLDNWLAGYDDATAAYQHLSGALKGRCVGVDED